MSRLRPPCLPRFFLERAEMYHHSQADLVQGLQLAFKASKNSLDPSTQVGAVLSCGMHKTVVEGWNHLPYGVPVEYWHDREKKYQFIVHAEEHSLLEAAKRGLKTEGSTMMATWACCGKCAGAMVVAGVKCLVVDKRSLDLTPPRWRSNVEEAHRVLRSNGVSIVPFDYDGFRYRTLFNGERWENDDRRTDR